MTAAPDRNWRAQARRARRAVRHAWTLPAAAAGIAGIAVAAVALVIVTTPPAGSSSPAPTATEPTPTPPAAPSSTADGPSAAPVSVDDPEVLARTWAEAFFTRAAPTDDAWQQTIAPFTSPDLLAQLAHSAYVEGTALEAVTSTTVTAIEIHPQAADAEVSTPIRWSHTVQVSVVDEVGAEHRLEYSVIIFATDDGWLLTDATLLDYERP